MSWFSRCSWCGGPFNGGNCRHCTNVSFEDEFVNNPEPILNDETPDFSNPPSQPQTSSLDQWHCFHCKDSLERGEHCKRCSCKWCGSGLNEGFCFICASSNENSSNNDLNSNSFNDPPNYFTYPPQPQYETYLCELCGNNSHYGYDCPPQFLFVYEQEPCYNQNYDDNYYSHNSSSFLCCNYGGPHESFQCQPMNQNHFEHNSNYSGFDQTPQFSVTHQLPRRSNKDMLLDMARLIKNNRTLFNSNIFPHEEMSIRVLLAKERILKLIQVWDEKQIKTWSLPEFLLQLSNDSQTINEILKQREEKRIEREQAANLAEQEEQAAQSFTPYWNFPMINNDDEEYTNQNREYLENSSKAIAPVLPIEEPDNSLIIKSSVGDLIPIPSESKGISDDSCDVVFCDNDHFDAEFGLIDSLLSRDISITSPKIDFLPEEFAGELDLIDPILPGIDEDDFDEEEGAIDIDILQIEDKILCEKLLNVNLLIDKIEALNLTPFIPFVLEYPSSSSILIVDNDFLIEEVDTFLISEDSIPPGIESDFNSEGDIIFLDDLLNDDLIPEYERFPSHLSFRLFSYFLPTLSILLFLSPPGVRISFLTPAFPLFIFLLLSQWHLNVRWKFAISLVSSLISQ
ncbi:hypothetical protein Tco_1091118 [Tanacetum coccineum]|uniref:RanBP2-type domain-containing protein n=1 Tax=Tanacetum coccineum TaxID=301880 RepID=A0ABQ5I680_9ASTR